MSAAEMPVPIKREFLGWDRPALAVAVQRLERQYRMGPVLDLGNVIVVVPGQRAGRRLQELLAFRADDDKLRLTPPLVVTESQLPEKLYTPKKPFANDLVQDLAWARALAEVPAESRQRVVPHPPAADEALRWLALGKMLRVLHVELAAEGLDFAAVKRDGPRVAGFLETERWGALAQVQERYHQLLDKLDLWDKQTARLRAVEFREISGDRDIILLGTVDLDKTPRQMLDQVAARVTAYVVAPADLAECFDAHGCLVPSMWCQADIPLRDEQLRQVDGPLEQADAVFDWLVELAGRFRKDDIVIGAPDPALVPQLQRQLQQCGVPARWFEGVRLAETGPYRLLAAAVGFAGPRRYDDLAALLRHPDLEDWLHGDSPRPAPVVAEDGTEPAVSLPAQLDRFYNAHLPSRMAPGKSLKENPPWSGLPAALAQIDGWLNKASAKQPLRAWGRTFRNLLGSVYGKRTLRLEEPADEVLHRTFGAMLEACDQLDRLPETLGTAAVSAADAFQIALGPLGDKALPPTADPSAIEILGWLELPLDDAGALVVTSFNEGIVPTATGAQAFLPDRLRRELGLLHNERRYARDAYAASVLCHSRQELRVLLARRDTNKDPLHPSRLVFACPEDVLIARAGRFFGDEKTAPVPRYWLLDPAQKVQQKSAFVVPRPEEPFPRLQRISVTSFKAYLESPYRYYLRHVRNLVAVDDAARELGGDNFGRLLHKVLGKFGRDAKGPRRSRREEDIFAYLGDQLDQLANKLYGPKQRRPAIRLQLEQARRRLRAFATHQAELVSAGWRIIHAENDEPADLAISFAIDNEPIELVGRIDRIDRHEAKGTIRILDYKTGDTAKEPAKTHHCSDGWIDLQLPLYRHLWRATGLAVRQDCRVELGYFNLPKNLADTKVACADWDEAMLAEADEVARTVIRSLRAEKYDFVPGSAPKYGDEFAAICLDNTLSAPALTEDDPGGQA
jgi:ATP-dependent helicase/nuclease subunit B